MSIGIWQLLLILAIVFVVFGAGKLPKVMGDLGKGVRNMKDGLAGDDNADDIKEEVKPVSQSKKAAPKKKSSSTASKKAAPVKKATATKKTSTKSPAAKKTTKKAPGKATKKASTTKKKTTAKK